MISIIVASKNNLMLESLKKNVASTLGVSYEIIAYENKNGKGIAEVYNEGALKAQYDILCFAHEDIVFKTNNWGSILIEYFKSIENVGLIGVVGSTYKSLAPSGWYADSAPLQTNYGRLLQSYKYSAKPSLYYNFKKENNNHVEVKVIDGLWFCTTKKIASETNFDEHALNRFHCYDLDFSLNVGIKYKVVVIFDILIEHLSEGTYDKEWVNETLKLQKKWKPFLPVHLNPITKKTILLIEKRNFRHFVAFMYHNKFSGWQIIKVLWNSGLRNLSFLLFMKLHTSVLTNPYKNKI